MSNINRRGFLRGLVAAPAIVAVANIMPVSARLFMPPKLWGDGIRDDTAALQWLHDEAMRSKRPFVLENGVYRVSAPLVVRSPYSGRITDCDFVVDGASHMMRFESSAKDFLISSSRFLNAELCTEAILKDKSK